MGSDANDDAGVGAARPDHDLARLADELATAVEAALPGWVEASVARVHGWWAGPPDEELRARAAAAGRHAVADVVPELRRLLAADVDAQWTNPLSILRRAVPYPTAVLREAGVPAIERDEHAEAHFPDDDYGLTPATFGDLDPSLHELGLVWGAMKARAHLARRRGTGAAG